MSKQLRLTLKGFYANLGDLTAPKRQQPGASVFRLQMGSNGDYKHHRHTAVMAAHTDEGDLFSQSTPFTQKLNLHEGTSSSDKTLSQAVLHAASSKTDN